jgi:ATP-dependent DNA ligase
MSAPGAKLSFTCMFAAVSKTDISARSTKASTRRSCGALREKLMPQIRKTQPYAKKIAHRGIWVEPQLLAEIQYRAKSAAGKVRHPFFKGLREDL